MTLPRAKLHRATFVLAGIYNIGWGLYAAIDPDWVFRFAGMAPQNHPEIFMCLGMVIGLYGVVYLEIARRLERGGALAAIGLAGKVLGPIGMALLIARRVWPPGMAIMCLTNDLIWWLPFSLYLKDVWPALAEDLRAGAQRLD